MHEGPLCGSTSTSRLGLEAGVAYETRAVEVADGLRDGPFQAVFILNKNDSLANAKSKSAAYYE
jgi:hypothetical protein